jgi:prophage tail gpP-like protein
VTATAQLLVDGTAFAGWTHVRVTLGIDQIAGTFELGVSERWPSQDTPRLIAPGARCQVVIDRQSLIHGFVDEVTARYDAASHEISVSGRDATADLVDCHLAGGHHVNRTLLSLAEQLCKPFGIPVSRAANVRDAGIVADVRFEFGESVFEALERIARLKGVLLMADGRGGLVLARAGVARVKTALVRGENILEASGTLSFRERYSEYTAIADPPSGAAAGAAGPRASVWDDACGRFRPCVVRADDESTREALRTRATWERHVRAGRSVEVSLRVQGWHHADGLWTPNTLVRVRDPWLRLDDDELLIRSVTYALDENGTTCELALTLPAAYLPDTLPQRADKKAAGKKGKKSKEDNWWLL